MAEPHPINLVVNVDTTQARGALARLILEADEQYQRDADNAHAAVLALLGGETLRRKVAALIGDAGADTVLTLITEDVRAQGAVLS